jgi:hypothetical protein
MLTIPARPASKPIFKVVKVVKVFRDVKVVNVVRIVRVVKVFTVFQGCWGLGKFMLSFAYNVPLHASPEGPALFR